MQNIRYERIDTRNTKYQGELKSGRREGVGIMIDDGLNLCMSQWANDQPSLNTIVACSHQQAFYGDMLNNKPSDICSFSTPQYIILGNFREGVTNKVAIIFANQLTVYCGRVNNEGDFQSLKVVNNFPCSTPAELWREVGQILGVELKQQNKSLTKFIQINFCDQSHIKMHHLLFAQYLVGYNNQTIGMKIKGNEIISIGMYNDGQLKVGRKYQQNSVDGLVIHEGIFENQQVYKYKNQRPIKSRKAIQQYFKKSTQFRNQFTNINYINNIEKIFKQIQKGIHKIQYEIGQIMLQGFKGQNQIKNVTATKQQLDEVKKQIYQAIEKKKIVRRYSPYDDLERSKTSKHKFTNNQINPIKTNIHKNIISNQISQFTLYPLQISRNLQLELQQNKYNQILYQQHLQQQCILKQKLHQLECQRLIAQQHERIKYNKQKNKKYHVRYQQNNNPSHKVYMMKDMYIGNNLSNKKNIDRYQQIIDKSNDRYGYPRVTQNNISPFKLRNIQIMSNKSRNKYDIMEDRKIGDKSPNRTARRRFNYTADQRGVL